MLSNGKMCNSLTPAKALVCTDSPIGHDTLRLWLCIPRFLPFSHWDMASPVGSSHLCASCCHTAQSMEMYNDSWNLGESAFKIVYSSGVLVRLRRTGFKSVGYWVSVEPTFRIRECGRQGMGPWAHLVHYLHLVVEVGRAWMPSASEMDKVAWWESEVLSL